MVLLVIIDKATRSGFHSKPGRQQRVEHEFPMTEIAAQCRHSSTNSLEPAACQGEHESWHTYEWRNKSWHPGEIWVLRQVEFQGSIIGDAATYRKTEKFDCFISMTRWMFNLKCRIWPYRQCLVSHIALPDHRSWGLSPSATLDFYLKSINRHLVCQWKGYYSKREVK